MRIYPLLLLTILLFGCKQDVEDLQQLNGYWEIEKVYFKNGKSKGFNPNTILDHFELKADLTGSRKKVKPLLDGTFMTTTDGELIQAIQENGVWFISYQTHFSSWTERIETLNTNQLVLVNEDRKTYSYKRYTPKQEP